MNKLEELNKAITNRLNKEEDFEVMLEEVLDACQCTV